MAAVDTAVEPFGWLGSYDGFEVLQSCTAKPNITPSQHKVVLAPADFCVRCKLYWNPAFCLLTPNRLDYQQLVRATTELVTSCPVIAGRLDLTPPVSIRQDADCWGVTLSEANWPSSSSKDFEARCTHFYAQPPPLNAADEGFLPAPPYEDPIESKNCCSGNSPLFKLRLTHLGDGSSLLTASWSHALTDGFRATEILNSLAALYRGQLLDLVGNRVAMTERNLWPVHLKPFQEALGAAYDGPKPADAGPESQEDLRKPSLYAVGRHGSANTAMRTHLWLGYSNETHLNFTVHITQDDLVKLKASLAGHAALADIPFFSTNDIITGLAWLLACDARKRLRPGQKEEGQQSKGFVLVEYSKRGVPAGLLPKGYTGNMTESVMMTCMSDGSMTNDPNSDTNLMHSLAAAICSTRKAILQTMKPNWGLQTLAKGINAQTADNFQKFVDAVHAVDNDIRLTNWNTFNNKLDFGSGSNAHISGYFRMAGANLCCVVERLDGNGVGLRFESTWVGYKRVLGSPILPSLAPSSGVPKELQDALHAHSIQ